MLSSLLILLTVTLILGVVFLYSVSSAFNWLKALFNPYNFFVAVASVILWCFNPH
jgi:hypothetical protein